MNLGILGFVGIFCFHFIQTVLGETECPVPMIPASDRRTNKQLLRVAQYNVEWLFIDYCSSSDCPGSGCTWKNDSEAQTHLSTISNNIKSINPDIMNFAEIEGCDEINLLRDNLDDSFEGYLIQGTDTSTGQNVGMISRIDPLIPLYRTENRKTYPIEGSTCGYTGEPKTTGVSKHYITEFLVNDIAFVMLGIHLLAQPTEPTRCAKREAQALVIQEMIAYYLSMNYEVIVVGDFNDYDGMVLDKNNNNPTSKVLEILKGDFGTYKDKYQLYSVAENLEQSERYSDWYDKNSDCQSTDNEFSQIDHILVSEYFFKSIQNVSMFHSYKEYCNTYNSDHYPLIVDFLV